jgi:hypothetical protein
MLGDSELDKFKSFSDRYAGIKTLISGARPPNFSQYNSTPDLNSLQDGLDGLLNPDTSGLELDSLMNGVLGAFASAESSLGAVSFTSKKKSITENVIDGGLFAQLLQLILGIIQIPIRFGYLSMALTEGTGALVLGIGGMAQSVALGTKDIFILFFAILKIVLKYFSCILSFVITTIGGCLGIHMITMFFVMLYLFIMFILDSFNEWTGIDMTPMLDKAVEYVGWPDPIGTICYSCFGKKVKLREVISDVGVIEDIGNMISYDFKNTMPRYMNPAVPLGTMAMDSLDKAVN